MVGMAAGAVMALRLLWLVAITPLLLPTLLTLNVLAVVRRLVLPPLLEHLLSNEHKQQQAVADKPQQPKSASHPGRTHFKSALADVV